MVELWFELLSSIVILGVSVGIAIGVTGFVKKLVQRNVKRTQTTIDNAILPVLNWPLGVGVMFAGVESSPLGLEAIQRIPWRARSLELGFPIVWILLAGLVA